MCSSSSDTALRRSLIPFFSSGISRATLAAISDFQAASNRAVDSSRCLARRLSRAVPISGLSSDHERIAAFDFLSQPREDLADDARGPGANLDLPVRVGLDLPHHRNAGRDAVDSHFVELDLRHDILGLVECHDGPFAWGRLGRLAGVVLCRRCR